VPVDRNQYNAEETTTFGLDVLHRISDAVETQLLLGRGTSDADFVNPPDPPATGAGSISRTGTERRTAEARAQIRGPAGVRGLAGISYDDQHQESTSEFDDFADTPFEADRDNWGVYVQASALPLPRLQLTAGGRLDENARFGSFWTYRAGALAFAAATTRLRASVGTGFKEPSFFENFSTSFTRGNPDLRPERSFSVEGGVEQDLAAGRVGLAVTAFAQRFRDLIQYNPVTASPEDPNFWRARFPSPGSIPR
jgi:vitamin B12 transporter